MNREALIAAMQAAAATPPKKVEVAGWGTVYLKPMTVEQVDLQQQEPDIEGADPLRFARGAARIICDERGVLLFDPLNKEDLELIAKQPWESLKKVIAGGDHDAAQTTVGDTAVKKA